MLPLLALNRIGWKRIGVATGVAVLVGLIAALATEFLALRKARLAYEHPRVVTVTKKIRVEGPVRIVTRTVRDPGGREEVTREEVRGAVVERADDSTLMEPVFMPAACTSGWLLGASVQPFHRWERGGWAAWGGYAIGGRLHLLAGIRGNVRAETMILWRF